MEGKGGDDTLLGHADGDELWGGPASDLVYGGPGDDFVLGDQSFSPGSTSQAGDDVIYGGAGNDNQSPVSIGGLYGGPGEDVIFGGDGNDFVVGAFDGGRWICSFAVKAGTNTLLTGSTMCRAVAR